MRSIGSLHLSAVRCKHSQPSQAKPQSFKTKNPLIVDLMMPRRGLEPPTREGHTPQACAYASSATGAHENTPHHYTNAPKGVNSLKRDNVEE